MAQSNGTDYQHSQIKGAVNPPMPALSNGFKTVVTNGGKVGSQSSKGRLKNYTRKELCCSYWYIVLNGDKLVRILLYF